MEYQRSEFNGRIVQPQGSPRSPGRHPALMVLIVTSVLLAAISTVLIVISAILLLQPPLDCRPEPNAMTICIDLRGLGFDMGIPGMCAAVVLGSAAMLLNRGASLRRLAAVAGLQLLLGVGFVVSVFATGILETTVSARAVTPLEICLLMAIVLVALISSFGSRKRR